MLDVGVAAALRRHGIHSRHVAFAEREASSCAALRARMEDAALEPAPIWGGNLQDFPTAPFCGLVDGIVAGFPCQPFSVAGKQLGQDDERHLLPEILRIADAVGASIMFLENVPGLKKEFDHIAGLLLQSGWHTEWGTLKAADVGASHRRERWFCVAYRQHVAKWAKRFLQPRRRSDEESADRSMPRAQGSEFLADSTGGRLRKLRESSGSNGQSDGSKSGVLADSIRPGLQGHGRHGDGSDQPGRITPEPAGPTAASCGELGNAASYQQLRHSNAEDGQWKPAGGSSQHLADGNGIRLDQGSGMQFHPDSEGSQDRNDAERCSLPIFAPGPSDPQWSAILDAYPLLAPALPISDAALRTAWSSLLGGSEMEAQSGFRFLAHGVAPALDRAVSYLTSRAEMLRIAGNGVVWQQAAAAFEQLLTRISHE